MIAEWETAPLFQYYILVYEHRIWILLLFQTWNIMVHISEVFSVNYMSAKEAAEKWGISQRRVSILCTEMRIPGAEKVGNIWLIPKNAKKPIDGRKNRVMRNRELKPIVKWAGGKSQILEEISSRYPKGFGQNINKYAEPFVGGGAVLLDILAHYDLSEVYISDINAELINMYQKVKTDVDGVIEILQSYQSAYIPLDTEKRKKYYYARRDDYNELIRKGASKDSVLAAALFIFLNRTCFNGLYRVNRKGLFNVPMGSYKNPLICDEDNLRAVSSALQNVEIVCGDYRESRQFIDQDTFVYFDPPYRPLNKTSNFTSYTENSFDDVAQVELAEYVNELIKKGINVVVSNSDPKNTDPEDDFFDELYAKLDIERIFASRMINSNADARGKISELLICNYV